MTNPIDNPLVDQLVTFIQHDLPGLPDGEYRLKVSQRIDDSEGNTISDGSLENSYSFAVLGDRFQIKKPTDVYTVFPAANATGEFSTA
ncbi:MAG: hypothetical protein KDM64_16520, partial [Verrucomicrobiae bacterium]|nr:hypothetical protein [Verrucomicrobiae bacterium]